MGSEVQPPTPQSDPMPAPEGHTQLTPESGPPAPAAEPYRGLRWIFIGDDGLRAGWSVVLFLLLFVLFSIAFGAALSKAHLIGPKGSLTPQSAFFAEMAGFLSLLASAGVMSLIERRRILDYNLTGPNRLARFSGGLVAGFVALSVLVGLLAWGGWLRFGGVVLTGSQIVTFAVVWAGAFLLVGCVEEGLMRCYLLFTLARGINFWWAIGLIGTMCGFLILHDKGNGAWGVYAVALLGLLPCLLLHVKRSESTGFWLAAWVTSALFGFMHTGNNGENWIGIFAAAFIGFVFCVSVRVTGSAWWAIGCHAAWDWAETYFYGTPDSGMVAQGHYLSTSLSGSVLWSGGADGPEGSLLVLPVCLLLLALLLVVYGRRRRVRLPVSQVDQAAAR